MGYIVPTTNNKKKFSVIIFLIIILRKDILVSILYFQISIQVYLWLLIVWSFIYNKKISITINDGLWENKNQQNIYWYESKEVIIV